MFGGVGFMLNGNLLVGVWKDSLCVRLGPDQAEEALKEPHVREFDITGRPMEGVDRMGGEVRGEAAGEVASPSAHSQPEASEGEAMSWGEMFDAYQSARCAGDRQATEQIVKDARRLLSQAAAEDWKLLEGALHDQERKWLVAGVFSKAPVPNRLFKAMLRAAVYEVNPSLNRYFVEPCITAFGHRAVNEALLDYVEKGSDFEKAGAVNALYWGGMHLRFDDYRRGLTLENATPESRAAYLELKDVWLRKRCLVLREFVSNENVDVRRSIIPSLNLDEADYPDDLKPLVAQAVEIARSHEDDYIRHRVEVQLGNEHLYKPLPHRDSPHEQTGECYVVASRSPPVPS